MIAAPGKLPQKCLFTFFFFFLFLFLATTQGLEPQLLYEINNWETGLEMKPSADSRTSLEY